MKIKQIPLLVYLALLMALPNGLLWAASSGEELYRQHCSVCHQDRGKGGIGLPLTRSKLANVSDDYLLKTIRKGRPGRIMPAFEHLGVAQVYAIVGYIRSWYPDIGRSFSLAPVKGDVAKGQALYRTNCQVCHGADGSGEGLGTGVTLSRERSFMIMPAAISNPGFLYAAPDEMIKHTVKFGRKNSIMPSFKEVLSDQEINHVVAYVRSFAEGKQVDMGPPKGHRPAYIVESPYDFEKTVANVKAALVGANFRTFPLRYVEQGLIDEFSHNTRQVSIRFCNFKELYSMLNIEPRLGTVLPCRITVVEDESGTVSLISANVSAIAYWFNNDQLVELGKAMEEIIKEVMEEATL